MILDISVSAIIVAAMRCTIVDGYPPRLDNDIDNRLIKEASGSIFLPSIIENAPDNSLCSHNIGNIETGAHINVPKHSLPKSRRSRLNHISLNTALAKQRVNRARNAICKHDHTYSLDPEMKPVLKSLLLNKNSYGNENYPIRTKTKKNRSYNILNTDIQRNKYLEQVDEFLPSMDYTSPAYSASLMELFNVDWLIFDEDVITKSNPASNVDYDDHTEME